MPRSCTRFGANTTARPSEEPEPGFVAYAADAVPSASTSTTVTLSVAKRGQDSHAPGP